MAKTTYLNISGTLRYDEDQESYVVGDDNLDEILGDFVGQEVRVNIDNSAPHRY